MHQLWVVRLQEIIAEKSVSAAKALELLEADVKASPAVPQRKAQVQAAWLRFKSKAHQAASKNLRP